MKQPETRLRVKIRKFVEKEFGGFWVKIWGGPFQEEGIPDYLCCIRSLFFGFEVKFGRREATDLQRDQIDKIIENGGYAAVVYTKEETKLVVKVAMAASEGRCKFLLDSKRRILFDGTRHWKNLYYSCFDRNTGLSPADRDRINRMPGKRSRRMERRDSSKIDGLAYRMDGR